MSTGTYSTHRRGSGLHHTPNSIPTEHQRKITATFENGQWTISGHTFMIRYILNPAGCKYDPAKYGDKNWHYHGAELPDSVACVVTTWNRPRYTAPAQVKEPEPVKAPEPEPAQEPEPVKVDPVDSLEQLLATVKTDLDSSLDLTQVLGAAPEPEPVKDPEPEPVKTFVKPSYYDDLALYLTPGATRPAIALVGPAGNGKTTVAENALKERGIGYVVIDATEFTEPADLIGAMTYDPQKGEVWRDGPITRAFRDGLAILINEFDALNPRAALCLQSVAQDAGPDKTGRYVTCIGSHEDRVYPVSDCPLIVTMNTYGTGATRDYVGRNALDAATMDRYTVISTDYENETAILMFHGYAQDLATTLEVWAHETRKKIADNSLRIILSNRTLIRIAQAITSYRWTWDRAIEKEFFGRLEPEYRELIA